MKLSRVIILLVAITVPQVSAAQTVQPNRAWKPFFASFRAVVKKRDRQALEKMMDREFYYLSSGGDENDNEDTRDEAFEYWQTSSLDYWKTLDTVLAQGAVVKTTMPELARGFPSRIAPPLANNQQAIKDRKFEWFAIFEFKDNRWYLVALAECCD